MNTLNGIKRLTLLFAFLPALVIAQSVSVDPAFPSGSGPNDVVRAMAREADGSLLIGGWFTNVSGLDRSHLARLDTNGEVDATFTPELDDEPTRIQPLSDGQILISGTFTVVGGMSRPGLARLNADGSLDTGFTPPPLSSPYYTLVGWASPDGHVYVTGTFTNLDGVPANRLARLLPDGSVDSSFQSPFEPNDAPSIVALQSDGKPLVSGAFTSVDGVSANNLVRLNLDGSVDTSFHSGLATNEGISRSALQPDGSLVVSTTAEISYSVMDSQMIRLNADGSVDPTFNVNFESPGFPFLSKVYSLAIQPDGGIIVGGTFLRVNGTPRARIARLQSDGTLDYCYDVPFGAEVTALALDAAPDGSVIVGGLFNGLQGTWKPNLIRLLPPTGCEPGVIELAVPYLFVIEDAGRVVVPVVRHGGADLEQTVQFTTRDGWARAGTDYEASSGTVHFAPGERSQSITIPIYGDMAAEGIEMFEVVLSQPGNGASLGGQTNALILIGDPPQGTAGAADTNYVVQLDGPVQHILPLSDGWAVIAGAFTNVSGEFCPNLCRLRADGSNDPDFTRTQPLDGEVESLAIDTQGRLLIAGYFKHVDGIWQPGLARLLADGSLDSSFAPFASSPTNSPYRLVMNTVTVMRDDSIICGGSVPEEGYYDSRGVLLKLSPNGEIQGEFTNQMPPHLTAVALKTMPDGDLLLRGSGLGSALIKLRPDGTINSSFLPSPDVQFTPYYDAGLDVMPDGRVMVAGLTSYTYGLANQPPLWRLNPDGSTDRGFSIPETFGSLGQIGSVYGLSVAPDGSTLLAATFANASGRRLARLHADGSLDRSFDTGSGVQPPLQGGRAYINALTALPTGGWLVGGDFGGYDGFAQPYLVKLLPKGLNRPLTFQFAQTNVAVSETNSTLTLEVYRRGDASRAASVTVQTLDGTAASGQDFVALDERLDFAPGQWSKPVNVSILDDHLVEPLEQFTIQLADPTGGFQLGAPTNVSVQIESDDAEVEFVASEFQGVEEEGYALAAVTWRGSLSTGLQATVTISPDTGQLTDIGATSVPLSFSGATNWFTIPLVDDAEAEGTETFTLQLAGSQNVLPGSRSNATLVVVDRDFETSPARGVAGVVEAIANSPEGGVYLAGDFTGVHGVPLNNVARLRPDGEVDERFDPGTGPNGYVTALAVQSDGGVLIGGQFTTVQGVPRSGLARLNDDGSLDLSFDPGLGLQGTNGPATVRAILPHPDGIFVGGAFTQFNNYTSRYLVRLDDSGHVDRAFASPFVDAPISYPLPFPIVRVAPAIHALTTLPDGSLLVAGALYMGTSSTPVGVVRLSPTGQLTSGFSRIPATARSIALTQDNKILVGFGRTTGPIWRPPLIYPRPLKYPAETNWLTIRRFTTNGQADVTFQVRNVPSLVATPEVGQLLVQPDGRILFCAALSAQALTNDAMGGSSSSSYAIIGRLLSDGSWDDTFEPVTCELPVLQEPGPFWFSPSSGNLTSPNRDYVPTVSIARQPDGVLVLAGAFDSVSGESRRRLARLNPDGTVRGRLNLELISGNPLRLMLPAEVETPYTIETSTDLNHWSKWLFDGYPWWSAEVWLYANEPVRYFRAQPLQ